MADTTDNAGTEVWPYDLSVSGWPGAGNPAGEPTAQGGELTVEEKLAQGQPGERANRYPRLEEVQAELTEKGPMRMKTMLATFGLPHSRTAVSSMFAKLDRWVREGDLDKPMRGLYAARAIPTDLSR
ncbi:hypothetical protein [Streptomyces lydicus]|uniref:hypothetical protein n=1 Tax=Streptomyces lydicus TaxID=47763 RepID=UPI0010132F0E|nr:hypothetical protein [Streptomyces lydicus]MCZ1011912.1 hypothetical protein [Streptomyces lydicus]